MLQPHYQTLQKTVTVFVSQCDSSDRFYFVRSIVNWYLTTVTLIFFLNLFSPYSLFSYFYILIFAH